MRSFDDLDIDNYNPFDDVDVDPAEVLDADVEAPISDVDADDLEAAADALLREAGAGDLVMDGDDDVEELETPSVSEDVQDDALFGRPELSLHRSAFDSGRYDTTPFREDDTEGLLAAIEKVQEANLALWIEEHGDAPSAEMLEDDEEGMPRVGGSDEEGAFLARMVGYMARRSRMIASKIDAHLDWDQEAEDLKQDAAPAVLYAVRKFRRDPKLSVEQNGMKFWGLVGAAMRTQVGRKHTQLTFGMKERDALQRRDVWKAKSALRRRLLAEAEALRAEMRKAETVSVEDEKLLMRLRAEPSDTDIQIWQFLADDAKEARKKKEVPLRERIANELGTDFESVRFFALRDRLIHHTLPEMIGEKLIAGENSQNPEESARLAIVRSLCTDAYPIGDGQKATLANALVGERFRAGDPDDLVDVVNVWIETVHGFAGERDLSVALRATLEEDGGLHLVDRPDEGYTETNIYVLAPAIMQARYGEACDAKERMRAEIGHRLLRGEALDLLGVDAPEIESLVNQDPEVVEQAVLVIGERCKDLPFATLIRASSYGEILARTGSRPDESVITERLLRLASETISLDKIRHLRDHSNEIHSIDQPIGSDSDGKRTLADQLEGGVTLEHDADLDPEDYARIVQLGREAHRTRTLGGNDLLKRMMYCLKHGFSMTNRENPEPIHQPLNATEIALFGGFTRTTAQNYDAVIEPAVVGRERIAGVRVPVRGPDGKEYPVERQVEGTILPHRRSRFERRSRGQSL